MSYSSLEPGGQGKHGAIENIPMDRGLPRNYDLSQYETAKRPWWDLRGWSKKALVALGLGVSIIIAIIIAVTVVEEDKKNAYPDYSQLNYSLVDNCRFAKFCISSAQLPQTDFATVSGTSFFDNFDYFTGYDPADGFVHYVPSEQAAQLVSIIRFS